MKRLWLLLLLTSCASGPAYSELPEGTQIVVYRPSDFINFSSRFWIEDNGTEFCRLHNAAFVVHQVEPGKHTLSSSNWGSVGTSRISFDVKLGETVYVKMDMNGERALTGAIGGMIANAGDEAISSNGPVYLGNVTREKALHELQGLSRDCQ